MPKGYWITWYHSEVDPAAHARYANVAGQAIRARGGRFLARGIPAAAYEADAGGHRCVIVEFDSVAQAIAAYESPEYREALDALDGSVEREVRIVEGSAVASEVGGKVAGGRPELSCSWCGKSEHAVKKLVAAPQLAICNECISLMNTIIGEGAT